MENFTTAKNKVTELWFIKMGEAMRENGITIKRKDMAQKAFLMDANTKDNISTINRTELGAIIGPMDNIMMASG